MQRSFSNLEYATKKKLTRRDRFLAEIGNVTPWGKLHKLIEPHYPKSSGPGRPTIGLARMLRMYVVQQCFGLSDEGIENAISSSQIRKHDISAALWQAQFEPRNVLLQ
jgi:IS5 family transposase